MMRGIPAMTVLHLTRSRDRLITMLVALIAVVAFLMSGSPSSAQAITPVPRTTTRDIAFTSYDGYPMLGRLTLPDTPGRHPVMMLVQTAEAQPKDGQMRPPGGERVPVYTLYRANLAPLGIGFF